MRVDRKTLWLLVPLALAAAPAADARILGGGVAKSDCYMYFDNIDKTKGKFVVECHDGDAACDHDAIAGKCTFTFDVCVGASDVPGCTPADVTGFKGTHGLTVPTVPATPGTCVANTYVVMLKKHGTRQNSRRFKPTALIASGKPNRDLDQLLLKCLPPVPSPAGAFVFE